MNSQYRFFKANRFIVNYGTSDLWFSRQIAKLWSPFYFIRQKTIKLKFYVIFSDGRSSEAMLNSRIICFLRIYPCVFTFTKLDNKIFSINCHGDPCDIFCSFLQAFSLSLMIFLQLQHNQSVSDMFCEFSPNKFLAIADSRIPTNPRELFFVWQYMHSDILKWRYISI